MAFGRHFCILMFVYFYVHGDECLWEWIGRFFIGSMDFVIFVIIILLDLL